MGACQSTTKSRGKTQVKNVSANPGQNDPFSQMRNKYKTEIASNPFANYGGSQQNHLEQEYENSKSNSPHQFFENQKNSQFTMAFKQLYSTCYLKCEPIINDILNPPDKKKSDRYFFNIAMYMLSNVPENERKRETAKSLLMEGYDGSQKKYNTGKIQNMYRNIIEICMNIAIYFGLISVYLAPEEKQKILEIDNYMVENNYPKTELDNFFFDKFMKCYPQSNNDMNTVIDKWQTFLLAPITPKANVNEGSSPVKVDMKFKNVMEDIGESQQEELEMSLMHMWNPNNFFEVLIGNEVPEFVTINYKKVRN